MIFEKNSDSSEDHCPFFFVVEAECFLWDRNWIRSDM